MPQQTTATAGLSPEMKTFYDRTLLERALPTLRYTQFGQERPLPRNGGKNIEFRRFESLAPNTTPLVEGVTPVGNGLNVTAVTATIAQYGDFITGSDLLDLTAFDPVLTETAQLLGEEAGLVLDTACRGILGAGTTVQYAGGVASRLLVGSTNILTVDEIRKAKRTLSRNKAKPFADGYYVAIVEPGATYDLESDPKWVTANAYVDATNLYTGEIGRIFGVRFVESTNALQFAGAGAAGIDVYGTLIFGQNAYGTVPLDGQTVEFIFHPVGSAGAADPLNQQWSSGWKAAETWKILNDLFMIRIEHACSS
jgi:N4-gp56 family major capsid protein